MCCLYSLSSNTHYNNDFKNYNSHHNYYYYNHHFDNFKNYNNNNRVSPSTVVFRSVLHWFHGPLVALFFPVTNTRVLVNENLTNFGYLDLGGDSQNFLRKFIIFFVTLRCFYGVGIHRKWVICDYDSVNITF